MALRHLDTRARDERPAIPVERNLTAKEVAKALASLVNLSSRGVEREMGIWEGEVRQFGQGEVGREGLRESKGEVA